jgi:diacylglycerol kinase
MRLRLHRTGKNPTFFRSSIIAAQGFLTVIRKERKISIAFIFGVIFTNIALWVNASHVETLLIMSAWTQVIVGEIFNTSLEKAMDYAAGREFHPLIKRGKDYAAASVFLLSILATFVSLFLIGVRLFHPDLKA